MIIDTKLEQGWVLPAHSDVHLLGVVRQFGHLHLLFGAVGGDLHRAGDGSEVTRRRLEVLFAALGGRTVPQAIRGNRETSA